MDERQAAVILAVQAAASDGSGKADALTQSVERHACALQSAMEKEASQMEARREKTAAEALDAAKTQLRKHTEQELEVLSREATQLSGKLAAVSGSVERLDQDMNRAFGERTAYLEGRQQEYTLELLKEIQKLGKKIEQLSTVGPRLEKLLTNQFANQLAENRAAAGQLSEQLKKQRLLMLAGMAILAVVAVLGLFF